MKDKITNTISGKHRITNKVPIKDKHGNFFIMENVEENKWAEHYKELLNGNPSTIQMDISDSEHDLYNKTDTFSKNEITAIKGLKHTPRFKTGGSLSEKSRAQM